MILERDQFSHRVRICFWVFVTIITSLVLGYSSAWASEEDEAFRECQAASACYWDKNGSNNTYCGGTSGSGIIDGKDNMMKIANYFITANIEGISDNAAAIAGLLGNFQGESSFNPYSTNGTYYGVYQTNDPAVISATTALGDYWGQQAPEDINDQALKIQLDMLTSNKVFGNEGIGRWPKFVNGVRNYGKDDLDSAMLYAEYFLVAFERAVPGGSDSLTPPAQEFASSIGLSQQYVNSGSWQAATKRREHAAAIYGELLKSGIFNGISSGSSSSSPSSDKTDGSGVTIIGDSITDGSKAAIEKVLPKADINSKIGRQFAKAYGNDSGYANLKQTIDNGKLRDILVFALGTNDKGLTQNQIDEVLDLVKKTSGTHQVILMTSYEANNPSAYAANNAKITATVKNNDNITLLDWASAVATDPSKYISSDNLHPTAAGQELFAKLIYDAVNSITTGLKASLDQEGCNNLTGHSPYTSTEVPQYFQCDDRWKSLMYGPGGINGTEGTSICESGCGPSSFAMMATILLGKEIFPSETSDIAGKAGLHAYIPGKGWQGSSHSITYELARHYGLQYKALDTCDIDTINKYLRDGWMIHTSGRGSIPFSVNGHYVGITSVDNSGNWFVADSAGTKRPNQYYSPSAVISAGMQCSNVKAIKK